MKQKIEHQQGAAAGAAAGHPDWSAAGDKQARGGHPQPALRRGGPGRPRAAAAAAALGPGGIPAVGGDAAARRAPRARRL